MKGAHHWRGAALLLSVISACTNVSYTELSVESVSPAQVSPTQDESLTVNGKFPPVSVSYSRSPEASPYTVTVGDFVLVDVSIVSASQLRGRLPAGALVSGSYDIEVKNLRGESGALSAALEVRENAVDEDSVVVCDSDCEIQCEDQVECGGRCELGQTCTVEAEDVTRARFEGRGGTLSVECEDGDACAVVCTEGGDCGLSCDDVDVCRMRCHGSTCELDCRDTETCRLLCLQGSACRCESGSCDFIGCSPVSCADGTSVCNQACL